MYKDLVDRNDSAPGVRARKERQSISDFRSLNTWKHRETYGNLGKHRET